MLCGKKILRGKRFEQFFAKTVAHGNMTHVLREKKNKRKSETSREIERLLLYN